MLLRNGKRKLNLDGPMILRNGTVVEPPKKKTKRDKHRLYINDINTFESELHALTKYRSYWAAVPTVKQIISERAKRPFTSRQDLAKRVSTITRDSIPSHIILIFKTRHDEQLAIIYETLMEIESLSNQSSETIKCISEFATGAIHACDNPSCDEEILVFDEDGIENWSNRADIEAHTLYQDSCYKKLPYYHRGSTRYCGKCRDQIRCCVKCHWNIYFEHHPDSYNICPGKHVYINDEEFQDQKVPFQLKLCLNCKCCNIHTRRRKSYHCVHDKAFTRRDRIRYGDAYRHGH